MPLFNAVFLLKSYNNESCLKDLQLDRIQFPQGELLERLTLFCPLI